MKLKYCTLNFLITYNDGTTKVGYVPYRGESLDRLVLLRFIEGYFAGTKPYRPDNVIIDIVHVYDDNKVWLDEVLTLEAFNYLQGVNNFAGDLIQKYYPEKSS